MHDGATARGSFTLPGEAGCERFTLELAKRWGAAAIRDSDGTALSDRQINSQRVVRSAG
jgi:beta-D-galactosyl-(1->4)-L-rhamnose phosphorylase